MKPRVDGLKQPDGKWFYIASCDRCDWSWGWDGDVPWETAWAVAECHWWMYSATATCLAGDKAHGVDL